MVFSHALCITGICSFVHILCSFESSNFVNMMVKALQLRRVESKVVVQWLILPWTLLEKKRKNQLLTIVLSRTVELK